MARIRSVHPGLASDEVFMSMSFPAQAGWCLLWTECDDHGIFEWKPIVLKARLFPAANMDFSELLAEWELLGCIKKVEVGGKSYGLVRNFCKYQHPKSPSYRFSLPEEHELFVGVSGKATPGLPQAYPRPTEKPLLMKEEEEEEEGGEERKKDSSLRSEPPDEKKSGRKAKLELPKDWKLSEGGWLFARKNGFHDRETRQQIQMFTNHARQTDRRCADWEAAWRNWILKALEISGREPPAETNGHDPTPKPVHGEPCLEAKGEIYVQADTPEWDAWCAYRRKLCAPTPARYFHGGWHFPTRWPPENKPPG